MPEYLAPGVYVEEVSYRSPSIEGVGTTTTGIIGPTRYGPYTTTPDILTSLADFEQTYGDGQPLVFKAEDGTDLPPTTNWMWQAARAFFIEGGQLLYVMRTYKPVSGATPDSTALDGNSQATLNPLSIAARWPGSFGQLQVQIGLTLGQNVLGGTTAAPKVSGLQDRDIVWVGQIYSGSNFGPGQFYQALVQTDGSWSFATVTSEPTALALDSPPLFVPGIDFVCKVTLSVSVLQPLLPYSLPQTWSGIAIDPFHVTNDMPDSVFAIFTNNPAPTQPGGIAVPHPEADAMPIIIWQTAAMDGLHIIQELTTNPDLSNLGTPLGAKHGGPGDSRYTTVMLDGGNDGLPPTADEYEGIAPEDEDYKTGLAAFEYLDDISIVAAPGSTFDFENPEIKPQAETIIDLLIAHCEKMQYRIAVLDSGNQQTISDVRAMRAKIDSSYAALYYPWVRILDPISNLPIDLPPSGFVAGIYARNDINRAVFKAPANEVVTLAIDFEKTINKAQQEVLNPEGINCFRFFEDRGYRLWGARTVSSDQDYKYVNVRRYLAYVEHSLDKGTQWAVFEPNNERLWARMVNSIEPFLLNEFSSGALLGVKPEQGFFIRCDNSTMTQNDLDNGRLVIQIGLAITKPAEFVIIRIGQWTSTSGF
ncbi:MAG TPA: phage tail sheath subtilisin-like domain-containing protein [Tepidisphaeraceae bacterium]|nr:phage tail sheath subtilisin-like domain-containing protein [Tepidisphaeraceae bacterium]